MYKAVLILFLLVFHHGTALTFSNLTNSDHSKIYFGTIIEICGTSITESKTSYTQIFEFKTPLDKSVIELNITQSTDQAKGTLKLYEELDGMLIWTNKHPIVERELDVTWTSLLTDKTYYLVIDTKTESDLEVSLNLSTLSSPPNDLCEDAEELFGGEISCGAFAQVFPDPCATADPEATGNCVSPSDPGLWYTFSTPDQMSFNSLWFGLSPTSFEVFTTSSDCSGLVYHDCGGTLMLVLEPSTTYYILATTSVAMDLTGDGFSRPCDNPISWFDMGPGLSEVWGSNSCQEPSVLMPCQNDHVVWFSYDTGCESSDITIQVEEYTGTLGEAPADELSITAVLDDCSTLMSDYDVNGLGYLCEALSSGNMLSLEDVPPGTSFLIGIGAESNEVGNFWLTANEENDGNVGNDLCDDLIEVFDGENFGYSNLCASSDIDIPGCFSQNNNTVWFQYDAGPDPVDLAVSVIQNDITEPAIGVLDGCNGTFLGQDCGGNLLLECISGLLTLEVGSSSSNAGSFDLDINSSPALNPPIPDVTQSNICSGENAQVNISFPGGEIVDLTVSISGSSSSSISGMSNQQFNGVNSADISEILTNISSISETAVYTITVGGSGFSCPGQPIDFSFLVYPAFDIIPQSYEGCGPYNLPLSANDVIQGGSSPYSSYEWIWNGFDLIDDGDFLDYNFTESGILTLVVVDDNNCSTFNDIPLNITEELQASFDFPLIYCRSDQDIIFLPTSSLEGIEGNWSPAIIELELYPDGFIDLSFEPLDPMCNTGVFYEIEIYSGDEVEFDLPSIICSNVDLYEFPTFSDDGFSGTWDLPFIDLSTVTGSVTNYFTVNSIDCFQIYEYEFEVGDEYDLTFDLPISLCINSDAFVLPSSTTDGFTGTWSTPDFDQSNIINNNFTSTWTPDPGQSDCLGQFIINYDIPPIGQPMFNIPTELCQNDPILILPTVNIDQNSEGQWNLEQIDPSQVSGEVFLEFTPDDPDCYATVEVSIIINENNIPSFNIETDLCVLDNQVLLPPTSVNNIPGNWTIPVIDPSLYPGQEIESTFEPDATQDCTESISITFNIELAQIPDWNINPSLCSDSEDVVLPTTSINGLSGSWTTPVIIVEDNLGSGLSIEFIPDDPCVETSTIQFIIHDSYDVTAQGTDPSDCDTENGQILLSTTTANLEYSIDNGITWQSDLVFEQLGAGFYNILIHSTTSIDCIELVELSLSANEAPIIVDVNTIHVNSCINPIGSIAVEATGTNLEYSIDGGISWQQDGLFDNLSAGDYTVEVIQDGSTDCALEINTTIEAIIVTEIIMINPFVLSDCGSNDGSIEIIATGENVTYSIDGGLNFTNNNIFTGLDAGDYSVIVQSLSNQDCEATDIVNISAPNAPIVTDVSEVDPSDCHPDSGSLLIEAIGENLQFSIDNGVTWQAENLFENLQEGFYNIMVQDELNPNCFDELLFALVQIVESLQEPQLIITPLSQCNANDAVLLIQANSNDIEFSIDNGVTWQTQPEFQDLSAGNYTLLTRRIDALECDVSVLFEIDNPDCPCNDLQVEFEVNNIDCNSTEDAYIELLNVEGMIDPDIDVLWNNGNTTNIISDLNNGWYYLTIFYDELCEWQDSVFIEFEENISFDWIVNESDCAEINNGSIEFFNIQGGNGDYVYSIDGNSFQQETNYDNLAAAQYYLIVKDSDGCSGEAQLVLENLPEIEITLPETMVTIADQVIILNPQILESSIDSFSWTSTQEILNPGELIAEVSPAASASYILEIFLGECSFSHVVNLELLEQDLKDEIYINNVFVIGSVDNNSLFPQASNTEIIINTLSVYDRWGNLMFLSNDTEINNPTSGWDGLHQNIKVNPGVYVYKLDYKKGEENQTTIGTVTVLE